MNGRKSKLARKLAKELALGWLKTLVTEEESKKINENNFMNLMPKQTHFMTDGQMRLMPQTYRWFVKQVKDSGVDNINGRNAYNVVTANYANSNSLIDGFFITAGYADGDNFYNWRGGGFYCKGWGSGNVCNPILLNVTFSGNYAKYYGGAMYNDGSSGGTSNPILTDVTFSGNRTGICGGAVANSNGSPILTNVTFTGNQADSRGGAMCNYGPHSWNSSPILTNVTFSGNKAATWGGAMYNDGFDGGDSSPILTNVTFSGNWAGESGGAMYNKGGSSGNSYPQVRNSIIWDNLDINNTGSISASIYNNSARTYLVHSLVQGAGESGSESWIDDDNFVDGGGNIESDPLFITPVDPSKAPTSEGNLRLTTGSPAIDSGENSFVDGVPTDLDGKARKVDGDGNGTKTVDMGAYEFVPTTIEPVFQINLPIVKR